MRGLLLIVVALVGCSLVPRPVDRLDTRFADCGGPAGPVIAAFPFVADDHRDHFPNMGFSPELDGGADAFAVVFDLDHQPAILGGPLLRLEDVPAPEPAALGHFVCAYLGAPGQGEAILYGDVDIAWMRP